MIILVAGGSHTGKTLLAQRLMERHGWPYLSIDHLKMGLIRAGLCPLTPDSSFEELTDYLWPVVREMVKTAVENRQNLIVEGCYIPFDWKRSFERDYLDQIRYICLVFSQSYIENHFDDILNHGSDIEQRQEDGWCTPENILAENRRSLELCRRFDCPYILIDKEYEVDYRL